MNYRVTVILPYVLEEWDAYEGGSYELAEHHYHKAVSRITDAQEKVRIFVLLRLTPEPVMEDLSIQVHSRSRKDFEPWMRSGNVPPALKAVWTSLLRSIRQGEELWSGQSHQPHPRASS